MVHSKSREREAYGERAFPFFVMSVVVLGALAGIIYLINSSVTSSSSSSSPPPSSSSVPYASLLSSSSSINGYIQSSQVVVPNATLDVYTSWSVSSVESYYPGEYVLITGSTVQLTGEVVAVSSQPPPSLVIYGLSVVGSNQSVAVRGWIISPLKPSSSSSSSSFFSSSSSIQMSFPTTPPSSTSATSPGKHTFSHTRTHSHSHHAACNLHRRCPIAVVLRVFAVGERFRWRCAQLHAVL